MKIRIEMTREKQWFLVEQVNQVEWINIASNIKDLEDGSMKSVDFETLTVEKIFIKSFIRSEWNVWYCRSETERVTKLEKAQDL